MREEVFVSLDYQDVVYEAVVRWSPGAPAHGPTYSCGGYPGDPAEVDIIECVRVEYDEDGNEVSKEYIDDVPESVYEDILAYCEEWAGMYEDDYEFADMHEGYDDVWDVYDSPEEE